MLKISIITINKNNIKGLKKTINSVLEQTFTNYEYIVIDGNSDDGSKKLIQQYSSKIDYWISEPDKGIYNAMNKGIERANGEYCLFLNSGDFLYNETALEELLKSKPTADIVYTNQHRFGEKGERITTFPDELTFYWLYTEYLPHNCTLFKRHLFDEIGLYSEEYKIISDWLFYLIALAKYNCSYRHEEMILSSMEDGGISNANEFHSQIHLEREKAITEHFQLFKRDYLELYDRRYNHPFKRVKRIIKKLLFHKMN